MERANKQEGWLLFGLTGMVGEGLLARLEAGDPPVLGVSRRPPPGDGRVRWLAGELPGLAGVPAMSAIASRRGGRTAQ